MNGSPRPFFTDATGYLGIDSCDGKDVDRVFDALDIPYLLEHESFDTVLCFEILEHCEYPMAVCKRIGMVLKPGGTLMLSSPSNGFPEHRYPKDYWRFMPDAYRYVLLKDFVITDLSVVGPEGNSCTCVLAIKPEK